MPEASDTRMTSAAAVVFTDQSRIVVPVKLFKQLQCKVTLVNLACKSCHPKTVHGCTCNTTAS